MTTAVDTLPLPRHLPGAFSVEAFLAGLDPDKLALPEVRNVLGLLQRKIEIARRLAAFYQPDMKRPCSDEVLAPAYVDYLCWLYLELAERHGDWPALNTALKLLDGILAAQAVQPHGLLMARAERLLGNVRLPDA